MPALDKNIPLAYKLRYEGAEYEAAMEAWESLPTYKTDCASERAIKEQLRMSRMKKILAKKAV